MIREQEPPTQQMVSPNVSSDKDKKALEKEYPGFDFRKAYPKNSYGAFVYAEAVASQLAKQKKEVNAKNIASTAMFLFSGGTQGGDDSSTSDSVVKSVLGMTGMIAGFSVASPTIASILAGAGAISFVVGTVNTFRKNPKGAEKFPALKMFNFDKEWAEILDDDIEKELLEDYIELFRKRVNGRPEYPMTSIDAYINNRLKKKYNNRALSKPSQQQTP
mgnify:CR=1 FL=1